ncbi:MAG: RagB/SusD family nutrient uptake outer membrane protein [Bacteroidales bacterium]|nr:RagB/SusD family nutrient uptake outer membrane protein [Bacteroidales bacterium]
MKTIKNILILAACAAMTLVGAVSCIKDLDVTPLDPNKQWLDGNYDALFNKCMASITQAGNNGGDGDSDVDNFDGGMSPLFRQLWNANELTTDEAICGWGDEGISTFCNNGYDAAHPMLRALYYRLYVGISFCNHYLEVAGDHDAKMTAEVKLVRAMHYYLAADLYGNVPFTEVVASDPPQQKSRADVMKWVETQLLEIEPELSDPAPKKSTDSGYGRLDKAACWMLLSRLYLNWAVYTGEEGRWADAATYAKKVIDSPYKLYTESTTVNSGAVSHTWSAYQKLFMADNGESGASVEAIWPCLCDGLTTTSYGGSFFLIASTFNEDMKANPLQPAASNGSSQGWGGNRARPDLVRKFIPTGTVPNIESYRMTAFAGDDRAIFWGVGRTLEIEKTTEFKEGFSVAKFVNFYSDGSQPHDSKFTDADVFFMRVAEAYLTYAEATARQNSGKATAEGITFLNTLRARSHATAKTAYTLNDILDEWSREFYFEGRRRMDLVRYGKFGGENNYNWAWKNGVAEGANFPATRNIFAIPTTDLVANTNLKQNEGY